MLWKPELRAGPGVVWVLGENIPDWTGSVAHPVFPPPSLMLINKPAYITGPSPGCWAREQLPGLEDISPSTIWLESISLLWPPTPCFSWTPLAMLLCFHSVSFTPPQGLCTCCSLCLDLSSQDGSISPFRPQLTCHLLREAFPTTLLTGKY